MTGELGQRDEGGVLEVEGVDEAEWARRKAAWRPKESPYKQGIMRKYINSVTSASLGCVTDS